MVGAINPNGTQTLDAQIRAAASADFQVAPGEAVPKEGSSTLVNPSQRTAKLSSGTIAGAVLGGVAALCLCAWLLLYLLRRKAQKGIHSKKGPDPAVSEPNTGQPWHHSNDPGP